DQEVTSQDHSERLRLSGSTIKGCCGSKGNLDQSIWKAFGGNTHSLDSIRKKQDKIATLQEDDEELTYSSCSHVALKGQDAGNAGVTMPRMPIRVLSNPNVGKGLSSKAVMRSNSEGFREVVESGWTVNVDGCAMYHVVKCLKGLKSPFCKLLHAQGNLHNRVDLLRKELDDIQKAIDKELNNLDLREEHAHYLLTFKYASLDEESKCTRNHIEMVLDLSNILYEGNAVTGAFVSHYENFLGIEDVTDNEIKEALFSMGDDKAPSPNGFTSAFFKKAWDVVGTDVTSAIRDSLLMIISNRIKGNLDDLVSINQSAFVLGRRISDNILLTQELIRNYHRRRGPPRCAFKVDIQKAYDTVDWAFLESILIGFGFHHKMINRIMTSVSTTSYSVCVNGDLHGWFRGKRGLRQGDSFFPYLFTLVMEFLTLLLQQKVFDSKGLEEFKNVSGLVLRVSSCQCQGEMKRGKAKVAWDSVCKPKHEGGLVFCIWKTFGGNTRNLGSFREETDKTTDLHQHCSRISPQKLETTSQITCGAVTNPTTMASQDIATAEFLDPKKKKEIESWLGDSRIVDSFDESNDIKYFDTFPI
ncbi:putative reverse transcriptase domain, reverse transcriptase zinc-binding domain protein, partial [Tanacetum coccineum]